MVTRVLRSFFWTIDMEKEARPNSEDVRAKVMRSFLYDEELGVFRWAVKPCRRIAVGAISGKATSSGYVQIPVLGRQYVAHRLVWLIKTGSLPSDGFEIDHINGNRSDNRFANLRLATRSQNIQNLKKARADSESGALGVHWKKRNKKWCAQININGVVTHIGLFENKEDAAAAYLESKRKNHSFCTI